MVGALHVTVERCSLKLRQQKHPVDVAIEAVANRDVDEPVLAGEGHCRFAALQREGMQARAATATHDYGEHAFLSRHMRFFSEVCESLAPPLPGAQFSPAFSRNSRQPWRISS